MKSTIKTIEGCVTVQPLQFEERILISLSNGGVVGLALTTDEVGALIVGLEVAAFALEKNKVAA